MTTTSSNPLRYAWFVVALLFPVALLNYLDRQMLATMKASMVGDMPSIANKADWGMVLACFKWTYAVLSPFGGFIADRVSKRLVIGASLFVWSAVTWWTGHATTFHELIAARAHGRQRGVLHSHGAGADFRIPRGLHALARGGRASGGHLRRANPRRLRGLRGGFAGARLALGVQHVRHDWRHLRAAVAGPAARPGAQQFRTRSECSNSPTGERLPRFARQPQLPAARALLHTAGHRRLGRTRLDAGNLAGKI